MWGAYHGALVTLFHFYKAWLPDSVATSRIYRSPLVWAGGVVLTFALVTIGLVFFRMDVPHALRTLRLMLFM